MQHRRAHPEPRLQPAHPRPFGLVLPNAAGPSQMLCGTRHTQRFSRTRNATKRTNLLYLATFTRKPISIAVRSADTNRGGV